MLGALNKYIAVFLTGFVVTYLLTPWVRKLAIRVGAVDLPNERRPHKWPTARGGGAAVFIGVQAACLMALVYPWPKLSGGLDWSWWQLFALASLVLFAVGVVDDVRGLGPWPKLAGQVFAALLVWLGGIRFGSLFGMELPPFLDFLFVLVWIVAVINAFNLIDGLDGLASGLGIISASGLCGIFVLYQQPGNVLIMLALIGACVAFLRYNLHPASIFLGDTGSMFIGFTLAVVSLQTFNKSTFVLSLTIPMLVLGVPIYDALLAIWRRSVRLWLNNNQPGGVGKRGGLMQPDLDHLHHRLLKMGMTTRGVATFLCIGNAVLVISGLAITTFKSHASGIFLIVLRHLALIELRDTGTALLGGLRRPAHATLKALAYPVWDMFWLAGSVALAMWLFEGWKVDFWHAWFLDLPVWVTPTFSLLAISDTYVTVWSRARMRDVVKLVFMLGVGLVLSLGIALLIDPYNDVQKWLIRAWFVAGVSHPAIVGSRIIYRLIEELVSWSRARGEEAGERKRVVLYGAGGRCWLFLRERALNNSGRADGRAIIGIIDDDPALRGQTAYGCKVFGGVKDLAKLIGPNQIAGVVVTANLTPEARTALQQAAAEKGIQVSEWNYEERPIELQAIVPGRIAEEVQLP